MRLLTAGSLVRVQLEEPITKGYTNVYPFVIFFSVKPNQRTCEPLADAGDRAATASGGRNRERGGGAATQ